MKSQHILNSASNLLGVALVIITGLHISNYASRTYADELALAAATLLIGSCAISYQAIRTSVEWYEALADRLFLGAQLLLFASVVILWF